MPYTSEQLRNIRLAQTVGAQTGATRKEQKAAIEAMLVESNARNLNYGDRDSLGILQQRPSQGWKNATNPAGALKDFYAHARQYRGQSLSSGALAQAVQRSAFPDRYGQRAGEAARLMRGVRGGGGGLLETTTATTTTSPNPAYDQQRKLLLLNYLQNRDAGDSLLKLAQGMQDLPSPTTSRTTYSTSTSGGGGQAGGRRASGTLRELFYDPGVSVDNGKRTGSIGGHSDHVHVAVDNDHDRKLVLRLAKKLGVQVTSTGGGQHTAGSFHYQKTRRGKSRAIDFGGDPQAMLAFDKAVARRFRK